MGLGKLFFKRETLISAKVIADSINETGQRLTTFELEFPRMVLCFDRKTEILARLGEKCPRFMSFEEAETLGADVAQYDKDTGEISFVQPLVWIQNRGTHKMVEYDNRLKGRDKFSLSVTDKHRVLVDKRTTGNTWVSEVWEADKLLTDFPCCKIRQSGLYKGATYYTAEEIALMVWFASDGSLSGDKMMFNFVKKRKVVAVKNLLDTLGVAFSEHCYGNYTLIKCNTLSWVHECYDEDGFKKLPEQALYVPTGGWEIVKQALLESDGSVTNQDFNTTSKTFAEQVQVLTHLNGDVMNLKYYDDGEKLRLYKSRFKTRNNHILLRKDNTFFKEVMLEDTVFCVNVPTSFIVVRRDGIVHISGNCEVNTHGAIEKNTSSSRAIPVSKMLDHILEQNLKPIYFGSKKSGMQAGNELTGEGLDFVKCVWGSSLESAVEYAEMLDKAGVAKEVTNRITEPYQLIKAVWSATDWENWFNLRLEKDADPNICMLAYKMYEALSKSKPTLLKKGEYHLPYVGKYDIPVVYSDLGGYEYETGYNVFYYDKESDHTIEHCLTLEEAIKYSVASCAQVSYRSEGMTLDKAEKIWNMLVKSEVVHASPLTHVATPIVKYNELGYVRENCKEPESWEQGVTHMRRDGTLCSGRFAGFIQQRHLIENNTCYSFDFKSRMETFE